MISPHVMFSGFDAKAWHNFVSLFSSHDDESKNKRPTLTIVINHHDKVIHAFTDRALQPESIPYRRPSDLASIAEEFDVSHCLVIREGVLESIAGRLARRYNKDAQENYVSQLLELWRAIGDAHLKGDFYLWPDRFLRLPIPTAGVVDRAMRAIFPPGRSLLILLWNGEDMWTGCAMRSDAKGHVDWIAGPDLLQSWTGPLGGDWSRDYRIVMDAVSARMAPVHMGIYGDNRNFYRLIRDSHIGAWSKAIAVRDIYIYPKPKYVKVALAADAIRATARQGSRLAGNLRAPKLVPGVISENMGSMIATIRNQWGSIASVSALLGFDPLKALANSLRDRSDEP